MFKATSRVLIIVMMFVAFVGQTIAFNSATSCETSIDSLSTHLSELEQPFNSKSPEADSKEDCCGIECCAVGCTCIANACSSFIYFDAEFDPIKTATLGEAVYMQLFKQPKSISTLLYRPPIFIS